MLVKNKQDFRKLSGNHLPLNDYEISSCHMKLFQFISMQRAVILVVVTHVLISLKTTEKVINSEYVGQIYPRDGWTCEYVVQYDSEQCSTSS